MHCGGGEPDGFADHDAPLAGFDTGNRAVVPAVPGCGHRIGELLLDDLRLPPKLAQPTAEDDVWVAFQADPLPLPPSLAGLLGISSPWPGNPAAKSAWSGGSPQTLHLVAQPGRASATLAGSGCGWPEGQV
jgi:hypothetical protein